MSEVLIPLTKAPEFVFVRDLDDWDGLWHLAHWREGALSTAMCGRVCEWAKTAIVLPENAPMCQLCEASHRGNCR